jgi:aminopeptidase N
MSHRLLFATRVASALIALALVATNAVAEESPVRPIPERTFDALHLRGDLTIDVAAEQVRGTVIHTIAALEDGLDEVRFHAVDMDVTAVHVNDRANTFKIEDEWIVIPLDEPLPAGQKTLVAIQYKATPVRGMYFVKPGPSRPNGPTIIWTQGEPEDTRHWLPCWDYPNDFTTTEMIVHVPRELYVIGNGRLLSDTTVSEAGERTFHWRMDQPHATYLTSLVIGDYQVFELEDFRVPMVAYAPRFQANLESVRRTYGRTLAMMNLFERKIGIPYPWPKYSQVSVPEFRFGGMENISATTLYEYALQPPAAAEERPMDGLVAHELAHQWWGNLVTCQDWSHLWLNEGFATYFDALFTEDNLGRDAFLFQMNGNRQSAIGVDKSKPRPVVYTRYKHPIDMFDSRAYPKGACIVHMLRGLLGEDDFYRGLNLYLQNHAHEPVVTADLQAALERASGKDLDWFFEQWCYKAGAPKLECSWSFDETAGEVVVSVKQAQERGKLVPLFKLPTTVALVGSNGLEQRFPIQVDAEEQEFRLASSSRPDFVLIDPDYWLLADIEWTRPATEWAAQLKSAGDPLTRLRAAQGLDRDAGDDAQKKEQAAAWIVAQLEEETFPAMQAELLEVLGKLAVESSRPTVIAATMDEAPVVRAAAAVALRKFDSPEAETAAVAMWFRESAPRARAEALETVVKLEAPQWQEILVRSLDVSSFRNTVPERAVRLVGQSKLPEAQELLVARLDPATERVIRAAAIGALVERAKEDRALVERFRQLLGDSSYFARRAAVKALEGAGSAEDADWLEAQAKLDPPRDASEREGYLDAAKAIRKRLEKKAEKKDEEKS